MPIFSFYYFIVIYRFFLHLSVKKVIQSNQSRFYDIFQICRSWPRRGKGDYGGDSEVDIRFFAKLAK